MRLQRLQRWLRVCVHAQRRGQLALFVLELVTMLTLGRESMTYIVLTSFIEAFCIAGFFEETTKSLITRRADKFEKAHTASAILAHSVAGAATFATLENVF